MKKVSSISSYRQAGDETALTWNSAYKGSGYLTGSHQVKGVQQEEAKALNKEHIVAVFPHQEEGNTGGTHGEIAKHLREENSI